MKHGDELDGMVIVSKAWFQRAMEVMDGKHGCPYCGSARPPTVEEATETFKGRKGCLDCDRWWGPVELWER